MESERDPGLPARLGGQDLRVVPILTDVSARGVGNLATK
jgi:hypothetical protein